MDAQKTGTYLAMLRKTRGMTQQEVADQLGVSNKTVSKWESGGGFPDITVLPALAELYGVTADDILAGERVKRGQPENGGPTEVQKYLNRRDEFRFRLGAALSMVCAMAAVWYRGDWTLCPLLRAARLLAVWVGWSSGGCRVAPRLRLLLPVGAALLYAAVYRFGKFRWLGNLLWKEEMYYQPYFEVFQILKERGMWSLWLLLLPVLYGVLRLLLKRYGEREPLLPRPYFGITLAGWCASAGLCVLRWCLEVPKWQAYMALNSFWRERKRALLLYAHMDLDGAAKGILWATGILLVLAWLWKNARRPLAEPQK